MRHAIDLVWGGLVGVVAFFGMFGLAAAIVLMIVAVAYLAAQRRIKHLTVLMLGAGVAIALLAGRPLVLSWINPDSVAVKPPTYLATVVTLGLIASGAILLARQAADGTDA